MQIVYLKKKKAFCLVPIDGLFFFSTIIEFYNEWS